MDSQPSKATFYDIPSSAEINMCSNSHVDDERIAKGDACCQVCKEDCFMTALNAQNIPPDMSGFLPGPYFELADRPSLVRIAKGKTRTDAAEIFLVG